MNYCLAEGDLFSPLCVRVVPAPTVGGDSWVRGTFGRHRKHLCRLLRKQDVFDTQREAHAA